MSDYLSSFELADLIGCKVNQRSAMAAWLKKNQWCFVIDKNRLPKVARSYRDRKLGLSSETGAPVSPTAEYTASPNIDAFKQSSKDMSSLTSSTGVPRLYTRIGLSKISFWYKHPDGRSETLSTACSRDRHGIAAARKTAIRRARDIQGGHTIVGSVAEMVDRFRTEVDPTHYRDQSHEGTAVRNGAYRRLTKFFGCMAMNTLEPFHGYQYLDERAKTGAPIGGNRDMALMSTICHFAVRWGVLKANPFIGMMQNKADKNVRTVERYQVVRFYLWALRQDRSHRTMGLAAMFCYLTGFRAAEIRPFQVSSITDAGIQVVSAKRKKGEDPTLKLRHWSTRLRAVVERTKRNRKVDSLFLFSNRHGRPYSKSGWGAVWQDAMYAFIGTFDEGIAQEFELKKARETAQRKGTPLEGKLVLSITDHPAYFSMLDIRPAAITTKLQNRDVDAYDFAAHANPSTTHRNYDRRKVREASPTE